MDVQRILEFNMSSFGGDKFGGFDNFMKGESQLLRGLGKSVPQKGDFVIAKVTSATTHSFRCEAVCKVGFEQFFKLSGNKPFFSD